MPAGINHTLDPLQTYGGERVSLMGSFSPAGTGAPTNVVGGWFTVTRAGVGAFLLTFKDQIVARPLLALSLQLATPDGSDAFAGTFTPATSSAAATLVVQTRNVGGTLFDAAANADNVVHIEARVKNTGVAVPA